MSIVLYQYICLFVCKSMGRKLYLMKLQCILVILYILYILCYIMLFEIN